SIPVRQFVNLKVYNMLGQEVATLVSGEQSTGSHTVAWDATALSTGVYLYHLQAGSFVTVKRMVLVK
ncbi:MAG: T9SS type A sorting domain-containing protein, partial [Bacteroidota bacterium]